MTHSFPTRRASDLLDRIQHVHDFERPQHEDQSNVGTPSSANSPAWLQKLNCQISEVKKQVSQIQLKISSQSISSIRSEEHTSELQSLMRISYAVFFLHNTKNNKSCTIFLNI